MNHPPGKKTLPYRKSCHKPLLLEGVSSLKMRSIQYRTHQNKCVCIRFAFALNSYWSSSGRNTVLIPSTIISICSISAYSSQILNHGASFRQKQGRARQRESLARRHVDPHGPRLPLPVDDLSFGHDHYLSSVITCSQPKPRAYGLKPEKTSGLPLPVPSSESHEQAVVNLSIFNVWIQPLL